MEESLNPAPAVRRVLKQPGLTPLQQPRSACDSKGVREPRWLKCPVCRLRMLLRPRAETSL